MANDEEVVTGNVTFLQLAVNLSPAESLVAISFSKLLGFQKKKKALIQNSKCTARDPSWKFYLKKTTHKKWPSSLMCLHKLLY